MIMTLSSQRADGPPAFRDESVMIIAKGGPVGVRLPVVTPWDR
jgi:hypothetical protein